MVIRTPDYHLRVFVSSTLKELAKERKAVRQAILKLRLAPVMFEAGARPHPAQELYRSYLSQSQIFIGVYWQSYGWVAPDMKVSGLEDEYNLSCSMPRLIYIKNPAPEREQALSSMLDRIRMDNTSSYTYFSTPTQLKELVQNDLALLLTERFESAHQGKEATDKAVIGPPTNLPVPRSPLIGREKELNSICDLLKQQDIALVTLTGAGGTGKSRLAIQVGLEMLPSFKHGAYMVMLESVSDTHLLIPTIAELFNLRENPETRPVREMLREYLHEKQMLLLLDNFEQLVKAAPDVSELLEACPHLKCVITSRTPLRLRAEKEFPIQPLRVPPLQLPASQEDLGKFAAVELFVQRAQAVKPDFTISQATALTVAEICNRLDGLPLAIELAAARVKLLTPQGLLTRLDHRFDLLTSGTRDLPERQRTLRGTIDWSYNLLNDMEKMLFRRLAVFTGGFTLEAAEAVCDIDGDLGMRLDDALEALIDNNLVIQHQEYVSEPRFGMLSTIREYAAELLSDCEEDETIHQQHAQFFLDFVMQVEPRIRSAERVQWQQVLQQDFGNIRTVLEWVSQTAKYVEIGQQIFITLGIYWHICGYISEGQQWSKKMLALCNDSTPAITRAGLLCFDGLLTRAQGDQVSALESVNKSIDICRELEDKNLLGKALIIKGMIAYATRDLDTAAGVFQEAIEIFKLNHDLWNQVVATSWLGDVALYLNDVERESTLHNESIRLGRQQGDPWCLMPALMSSAQIDILKGEFESAYKKLTEIVEVLHITGDRWSLSWTLLDLGYVVSMQGNFDRTRTCILEVLSLANTYGNLSALIIALAQAGALLARKALGSDEPGRLLAAQLCGTTAPYINTPGTFIWINSQKLYDDAIAQARSFMEARIWDQGYSEGQWLPLDKAISLATRALTG